MFYEWIEFPCAIMSSIQNIPRLSYTNIKIPRLIFSNPSITYAPGLAIDMPKVTANRGQGHPLKSFSVPGPPPPVIGPPMTPPLISNPNKHNGKPLQMSWIFWSLYMLIQTCFDFSARRHNTSSKFVTIQESIKWYAQHPIEYIE